MGMEGADGFRPTTLGCGTMATVQQEGKGNQYQNVVRLHYKIPCFFFFSFQGFTSGGYCPSYLNSVTGKILGGVRMLRLSKGHGGT
jgi:hypothetical protein